MTAETTASAAASSPRKAETLAHENPAASALLVANRRNGDLADHMLCNLLRSGWIIVCFFVLMPTLCS
jgi:hypothetical protein